VDNLKPGMVVARAFYNNSLSVLLQEGVPLKDSHIRTLKRLNVLGVYIHDEFTKDIVVKPIVDDKSKMIFANEVNDMLNNVSKNVPTNHQNLRGIVKKLIGQISGESNTVINMLDLKQFDNYTFQHSLNVCILAIVMGVNMKLSETMLENMALAAVYHDIGKIRINAAILNKPGKLDPSEFEHIKRHPALGVEYLLELGVLNPYIETGVLQHHERYDGTGYPLSLEGERISLLARVISIVDVFDAITSKRPYKEANLPSEAIEYIMGNASQHFDFNLLKIFIGKVAAYPVGLTVELSNGLKAVVAETFDNFTMRPKVKIIPDGRVIKEPVFVNLTDPQFMSLTIVKVVE
jgi:HD-GYP domain-containing protein (c-di-GMP phosphodiesterase class II)